MLAGLTSFTLASVLCALAPTIELLVIGRILQGVAHRLGVDETKVIATVDHHANTSAASIPLAWAEGVADGRIQPGQLLLLEAMGGGFTWGASLVRI